MNLKRSRHCMRELIQNYVTGKLGRLEYSDELESGELPD